MVVVKSIEIVTKRMPDGINVDIESRDRLTFLLSIMIDRNEELEVNCWLTVAGRLLNQGTETGFFEPMNRKENKKSETSSQP